LAILPSFNGKRLAEVESASHQHRRRRRRRRTHAQ
jgi:hypothetical protein